jgi:hypothetical protein
MANVLTKNIWSCTSLGILSEGPVLVKAINFYPNAVDDAFQLLWWDEVQPATLHAEQVTYTNALVSADHVVTATTNAFPSTWLDGNVVKCLKTTGSDSSQYGLIKTAGNNTAFTVHLIPLTAEASKVGSWDCYPTYNAFRGHAEKAADMEHSMFMPFGEGFWFPNLALDSLSTSAAVDIYVG